MTESLSAIPDSEVDRVARLLPSFTPGQEIGELCKKGRRVCVLIAKKNQLITSLSNGDPVKFREGKTVRELCDFNTAHMERAQLNRALLIATKLAGVVPPRDATALRICAGWHVVPVFDEVCVDGLAQHETCAFVCSLEKVTRFEGNSSGARRHRDVRGAVTPHRS